MFRCDFDGPRLDDFGDPFDEFFRFLEDILMCVEKERMCVCVCCGNVINTKGIISMSGMPNKRKDEHVEVCLLESFIFAECHAKRMSSNNGLE